ncbi:hypothetical protein CP955_13820 [Enterobacter sp. HN503E2II]|nr:hypothetical protein CEP65_001780 [Enterobacter hormaechei]PVU47787.1 hypothetical protein CP954_08210 [Enterobacter sp. PN108E5IIB]PVU51593.1 hypothetical protein CP955_13820 [Enterobacter sp. HN503E2II]
MSTPVDREKRRTKTQRRPGRAFFVDAYQPNPVRLCCVCLFYVKSICVKSHIIVFKKVELDRRNGYI